MIISDLGVRSEDSFNTLSATIAWEDNDYPTREYYFTVDGDKSYLNQEDYNSFLMGAVIPALRHKESRIKVQGPVCPWFKDNLVTMMAYMNNWFWYEYERKKDDKKLVLIEAPPAPARVPAARRTATFFSGGVDSIYTLRRNRLGITADHPGAIRDGIFVHGFDMGTRPKRGTEVDFFRFVVESMRPLLDDAELNLVPVFTNIRLLDNAVDSWLTDFMVPAMGAVAHALSGRFTDVLVPSSYDIPGLHPFSSHPFIEPHCSSFNLRMHHDGERSSRVDRVALVSGWPVALETLRVCFFGTPGMLNCGTCAKCIRTKLELLCAGKLEQAVTLPGDDVTPTEISDHLVVKEDSLAFFASLMTALKEVGRKDLADAVRMQVIKFELKQKLDIKHLVKGFDQKFMGGWIKMGLLPRSRASASS